MRIRTVVPGVVLLAALVAGVDAQSARFAFVDLDDDAYITRNPDVLSGFTRGGVAWALRTFHVANWHPLTWMSHMADVEWFGLDAGLHHLMSAGIHWAGSVTLYLALHFMTGCAWRSALVAALFAVHPLHVESVAWVSERNDVLSGLLATATLLAYLRYLRRPGAGRYLALLAVFALGLIAKPMLVTLPFVLLLLDWWPLGRFRATSARRAGSRA